MPLQHESEWVKVTRGRSALRADLIEGLLQQAGLRYRRLGTRHGEMVEAAQGIFVQRLEVHPDDAQSARQLVADYDARAAEDADPRSDDFEGYQSRGRVFLKAAFYLGVALLLLLLGMT